jgi:putative hydrolase of the HAD superfamily
MLKAVIFDLDDTLIDWSGVQLPWGDIIHQQLTPLLTYLHEERGYDIKEYHFVERFQSRMRDAWLNTAPPEWVAPQHREVLFATLDEFGITDDKHDPLYDKLAWRLIPGVKAFPDAKNVLETLRHNGIKRAILTNAAQSMTLRDIEIETLGLIGYFDVRRSAADVGTIKPHPRPFRVVLNELGVTPQEAFYIGDRPQDDVAGAQAAGMRAIWVRRPHSSRLSPGIRPNAIVDSLTEMIKVIDRWFPEWRR